MQAGPNKRDVSDRLQQMLDDPTLRPEFRAVLRRKINGEPEPWSPKMRQALRREQQRRRGF